MKTITLMLLTLAIPAFSADVAVLCGVQLTRDSIGVAGGVDPQRQGSKPSVGLAFEYRQRVSRNWSVQATYSLAASNATFDPLLFKGHLEWYMKRHEVSGQIVRHFRTETRYTPFVAAGAGEFITQGGWAPGGVVGLDYQFQAVGSAGVDTRLTNRLSFRAEVVTHWFNAPTFSDPEYHASRTVIVEPRIGLTWRFGK